MKPFLYPFKTVLGGTEVDAWAVNTDEPKSAHSSVTSSEVCPHCATRHFYMFVDEPFKEVDDKANEEIIQFYHCKCATCRSYFAAEIELCY